MAHENIFYRGIFFSEKNLLFLSDRFRIYFLHHTNKSLYTFHGASIRVGQIEAILNDKLTPRHHFLSENEIRIKVYDILQFKFALESTVRNSTGFHLPEGPLSTWE